MPNSFFVFLDFLIILKGINFDVTGSNLTIYTFSTFTSTKFAENLPNSQLHPIELNCSYHVHLQAHFTPSTSYNYCFGLDETNCEGATTSIRLFFTWEYIPHSSLSFSIVFYSIFIEKCIQWKRTKRRTLWILGKPTWVTCTKGRCGRPMFNKFTIFLQFWVISMDQCFKREEKKN